MALVGILTNEGRVQNATVHAKNGAQRGVDSWFAGLYENTTIPGLDITLATIIEASGPGYARIQLDDIDGSVDSVGLYTNVLKTWVASADWPNPIYGVFVCTVATGTAGLLEFIGHSDLAPMVIKSGNPPSWLPTLQYS